MKICATAYVTKYTQAALGNREEGEIILQHSTGVYLQFGEAVFLLCDKSWGQIPIGITVGNYPELIQILKPKQGQKVLMDGNQMVFPGGGMILQLIETQKEAEEICPRHENVLQAALALAAKEKPTGLSMLVWPLVLGEPYELRDEKNPYYAYGFRYLEKLIEAFSVNQSDEVATYTEKLLGLGTGLTPSADDVLLGMLYVFRRQSQSQSAEVSVLRNTICRLAENRTNRISAAYLRAILLGAPFERMEQVYRGLCGVEQLDIEKLLQIGSNSGSEMLLGMLIALHICGYDVTRKEKLL